MGSSLTVLSLWRWLCRLLLSLMLLMLFCVISLCTASLLFLVFRFPGLGVALIVSVMRSDEDEKHFRFLFVLTRVQWRDNAGLAQTTTRFHCGTNSDIMFKSWPKVEAKWLTFNPKTMNAWMETHDSTAVNLSKKTGKKEEASDNGCLAAKLSDNGRI